MTGISDQLLEYVISSAVVHIAAAAAAAAVAAVAAVAGIIVFVADVQTLLVAFVFVIAATLFDFYQFYCCCRCCLFCTYFQTRRWVPLLLAILVSFSSFSFWYEDFQFSYPKVVSATILCLVSKTTYGALDLLGRTFMNLL